MTDNGEHILLATSATGPHPFPSRTRSLSLSAPMVLRSRGRGRVGRRQLSLQNDVEQRRRAGTYHTGVTRNRTTVLRDAFVLRLCLTYPRDVFPFVHDPL